MLKKGLRRILFLALLVICLAWAFPANADPTFIIQLTSTTMSVAVEEVKQLDFTVTASSDVSDKSLDYTSDNTAVAVVYNDGTVEGVSVGTANITIASHAYPTVKAICQVTVNASSTVTLNLYSLTMNVDSEVILKAVVTPSSVAAKGVTYVSDAPGVCKVTTNIDGSATLKAMAAGSAKITVTNADKVAAVCTVTVVKGAPASPTPTPTGTGLAAIVNTVSGSLNLRESPNLNAKVLLRIPQYASFTVLEYGSTWCKAQYNGVIGHVMTKFVKLTGGSVSPTPTSTGGSMTAYVNTAKGGLNLRSSPSLGANVLRVIPQNAAFTVLEYGSTWCKAQYNGTIGHVMTQFVRFTGVVTSPTPTTTGTVQAQARVSTSSGSLNLRESPSKTSKRITLIPRNAIVDVFLLGSDWSYIRYNGKVGYAMTKFLSLELDPGKTSPTPTGTGTAKYAQVSTAKGGLNLRKSASSGSKRILIIPQNAYVEVVSTSGKWTKVTYNGKTGFVQTQYLKMI